MHQSQPGPLGGKASGGPAAETAARSESTVVVRRVRPVEYAAVGELAVAAYEADGLLSRKDGSDDHYEPLLRDAATRDAEAEVWVAALHPPDTQEAADDHGRGAAAGIDVPDVAAEVLGTLTWCPPGSPWRELASRRDQGEFRMLAVPPAARRRGVARVLVEACVGRARADGMHEILLSSLPEMTAAHRLYRALGFVRAPEHDHSPVPVVHLWAFRLDLRS